MPRYELEPELIPLLLRLLRPVERDEAIAALTAGGGSAAALSRAFDALVEQGLVRAAGATAEAGWQFFGFSRLLHHRRMLADEARCAAFDAAIRATVAPGDRVLDVGSGSGLLSLLAARAGAARVIGLEATPIVDDARRIARENGLDDRVTFIAGDAAAFACEEPFDVLLGEWAGLYVVDEWRHFEAFAALRDRCLRPGGTVLPRRARLHLAAVEDRQLHRERGFGLWDEPLAGLDFRLGHERQLESPHVALCAVPRAAIVGGPLQVLDLDCRTATARDLFFTAGGDITIAAPATVHGFAGWFTLDLAPGIVLDTSPHARQTHWEQAFFSVEPVSVEAGDRLAVEARMQLSPALGVPELHLAFELRPRAAPADGPAPSPPPDADGPGHRHHHDHQVVRGSYRFPIGEGLL